MLLSVVLCIAPDALADETPPTEPGSLTGIRYSGTAGEILWTAAEDDGFIVGYKVTRDGEDLGIKDSRSLYVAELIPNQAYLYSVSAVDRAGNIGPELIVELSATSGTSTTGAAEDDGAGVEPVDPVQPVDDSDLVLNASHNRISLNEGDATGFPVRLSLDRNKSDKRTVQLTFESDSERDMLGMRYAFSSTSLAPEETDAVVSLYLDVTQAPLRPHQRKFRIVADDGESRTSTPLTIEVTPTSAPDVYLLIGQSNMEGYSETGSKQDYPGGLDQRVDRIKQLNVLPNNRSIFNSDELFTNESANVRQPTFVTAEDPLHEPRYIEVAGKGATFVGLGLTFAKETLRTTTADIYLVPAAWGATGFCANTNGNLAWNAEPTTESFLGGTLLADRALTRLNMTLRLTNGILRGILWHQGGADSNNAQCAASYADNLAKLADRLRTGARRDARGEAARGSDADIPFIVATQSKGDDERGNFSNFNRNKQIVDAAHRTITDFIDVSGFVNNDDLIPPQYPCGQTSCVHFGADALREQGHRFNALLKGIWSDLNTYHY